MLVCPKGAVRLVNRSYTSSNGLTTVSGVVQVCVNQRYSYLCADDWDDKEADVVCRSVSSTYQPPFYGMNQQQIHS